MKWEDFINNASYETENEDRVITDIDCPYCERRKIYWYPNIVYASNPPVYKYTCECGWYDFGPAYK